MTQESVWPVFSVVQPGHEDIKLFTNIHVFDRPDRREEF